MCTGLIDGATSITCVSSILYTPFINPFVNGKCAANCEEMHFMPWIVAHYHRYVRKRQAVR